MPNGKNKGNAFERKICVLLSRWWSNGLLGHELEDCFWRTSSSGGRATQRNKSSKRTKGQYGDVCATDPLGQPLIDFLTIELKSGYSKYTFADIIDKPPKAKKTKYEEWFEKATKDFVASRAFGWLLIVQRTRRQALVFMDRITAEQFEFEELPVLPYSFVETDGCCVCCMLLSNFLDLVEPKLIVQLASEHEKRKQC